MFQWKRNRRLVWAFSALLGLSAAGCSDWGGQRVQLFNGKDLNGWVALEPTKNEWQAAGSVELDPADPAKFKISPGTGILVNGPVGKTSNLLTTFKHGDCRAHIEFVLPKGSNSGVYFQGRYEIQVIDSFGRDTVTFYDCGAIYARWIDNQAVDGWPPRVNVCKAPGQWQTYDVIFKAPRFDDSGRKVAEARFVKVLHNGVLIHEDAALSGPTRASLDDLEGPLGPLMLQGDHGPVAYRNIWIEPLDLD
ncbi:MAG TPA: DUF1080 domain-containing protein [Phycisphaerae bacterium]|nr:DUF1080 domain-containing protein [Phycisphaerae bacterium]